MVVLVLLHLLVAVAPIMLAGAVGLAVLVALLELVAMGVAVMEQHTMVVQQLLVAPQLEAVEVAHRMVLALMTLALAAQVL